MPDDDVPLVAAGSPAVVAAAEGILGAGGSAVDAVVAGGFAATVAEPCLTSLAGGGFCLVRTPAGEETLVDFFVDTPGRGDPRKPTSTPHFTEIEVVFAAARQSFHCGPGSIAVPGCLSGYIHLHRRFGRLPLAEVLAPAIDLATAGVPLAREQAGIVALLEPIVTRTKAAQALFAPDDELLTEGQPFRNPDLARFLGEVADGRVRGFAEGAAHEALLDLTVHDGLLTAEDLRSHRVVERDPLAVDWRGRRVLTNPAPAFGGRLLTAALAELDSVSLPGGDPGWVTAQVDAAASVDARRSSLIATDRPTATRGTTHISVWDGAGGAASMTTSNGECSGDVIADTGILTNNILGEEDLHPDGFHSSPPGLRVASMMSPTIVVGPDGRTEIVLGSGGSKRIRSAITQVLLNVVVHGMGAADAVSAPRAHWDTDHTEVEPGLPDGALAALEERGPVNRWPGPSMYFGGAHLVVPGVGAAGDHRRDGAATVVTNGARHHL